MAEYTFMNPICQRNLCDGVLHTRSWDNVTLISIDIVSFTQTSAKMDSIDICKLLANFYGRVDKLSGKYNVDKIDIVGDAYVAVTQFADDAVAFCLATLAIAKTTYWNDAKPSLGTLHLRCGVHTGKVTGLVLDAVPFKYTLVGETVVTAKILEALTPPGHVNCSATTASFLDSKRFHLVCHSGAPESYLVYHAELVEKTVIDTKHMHFMSVSDKFVDLFGFERTELRSMRVVFGPKTRMEAIQIAMEQCVEFNHPTSIPVILYNRKADELRIAMEFSKIDDDDEEPCVALRCVPLYANAADNNKDEPASGQPVIV